MGGYIIIAIWLIATGGWIWNIVKLITQNEAVGMMLARVAGIFVGPVGAILGFF